MHKKRVTSALGLIIILAAVLLAVYYLKGAPPVKQLANEVIELRGVANDSVGKAGKIAKIDDYADDIGNDEISDAWETLTSCLKEDCSDDDYFNFLYVIFSEEKDSAENAEILVEVIKVNRYWGSEEVVEFSRALSQVNDAVEELGKRDVQKKWDEIVECNNICENKNNLYFELIKKMAG